MENEEQITPVEEIISEEEKVRRDKPLNENVVKGDFRKLQKKAKKLGAKSLDYSKRKDMKYSVTLQSGKKINFGSAKYKDYLSHKDEERRKNISRELSHKE